jgi:hypothetical protein
MEGQLWDVPLDELIESIGRAGKRGSIKIESEKGKGQVSLEDGWVAQVGLSPNPVPLGARLLRVGKVGREDLDEMLENQLLGLESKPLGQLLVESNMINQDELNDLLKEHFLETLYLISLLDHGHFSFDTEVRFLPAKLLRYDEAVEGLRRLKLEGDEYREKRAFTWQPAVSKDVKPVKLKDLSRFEIEVLEKMDGSASLPFLARLLSLTELEAFRLVKKFYELGLVEPELD